MFNTDYSLAHINVLSTRIKQSIMDKHWIIIVLKSIKEGGLMNLESFSAKGPNSTVFFCHSRISFICLIYLSLPNLYFYTIRSLTMFLKVLNKVNFRVLTQTEITLYY